MSHQSGDPDPYQVFLQWEPKRKQQASQPPLTLGAILCPVSPFLGLTKQVPNRKQKTGLPLEVLCFKLKSLNADDYKPETWAEWLDSWPTYQMFWGPLKSNITQTMGKCRWQKYIVIKRLLINQGCRTDLGAELLKGHYIAYSGDKSIKRGGLGWTLALSSHTLT